MISVRLFAYTQLNPNELFVNSTHGEDPELITSFGKRICNTDADLDKIWSANLKKADKRNIDSMKDGHYGAFEHIVFTFIIEGASRVETHQHVRHRISSYLQMSQRKVRLDGLDFIMPPTEEVDPDLATAAEFKIMKHVSDGKELYNWLLSNKIMVPGNARYIMPHGMETRIIVTINGRALLHFFKLRMLNPYAQWEIKEVARQMYELVKDVCPTIFSENLQEYWE